MARGSFGERAILYGDFVAAIGHMAVGDYISVFIHDETGALAFYNNFCICWRSCFLTNTYVEKSDFDCKLRVLRKLTYTKKADEL